MTTKLQILGPYTPEHEGPFCTREKTLVEILSKKDRNGKILGYVGDRNGLTEWEGNGQFDPTRMSDTQYDLMNAREVPVAREFWVNEFKRADGHIGVSHAHETELKAINERHELENWNWTRTIHVREVLPGDGE
ncbi:hypothetical protein [Acetobacter indonesiensis]|uniref:hypothetical protein n=1 Tax=Acetobacter indonesiensis TaxID=104101 RepID=UPI0039ECB2FC